MSLDAAITKAKQQNKTIFIDTYASYCNPCKQMEIEFRNPELSSYFNNNFLNVRVNMEGPWAEEFKNNFHIVFLPTLLFINPDGQVRMTIDHLVTARDLLNLGKHIKGDDKPKHTPAPAQPSAPVVTHNSTDKKQSPTPEPIASAPIAAQEIPKQTGKINSQNPIPSADEIPVDMEEGKILYVMGQDGDLPPEILREEAYFRMELMDGSHHAAAQKYLKTQDDWATAENMQFIHDFLHDARSDEFEFLIKNRKAFEEQLGKINVANSIAILVNKELDRAFPRPDKKRVKELKSYL